MTSVSNSLVGLVLMSCLPSCSGVEDTEFIDSENRVVLTISNLDDVKIRDNKLKYENCSSKDFHCIRSQSFGFLVPRKCPRDTDSLYWGWNHAGIYYKRISLPAHGSGFDGLFATSKPPYTALEFDSGRLKAIYLNTAAPESSNYPQIIANSRLTNFSSSSPLDCSNSG